MSSFMLPPLENIHIENIPEDELIRILDEVIQFAKSNLQSPERETYDFKKDFEGDWDFTTSKGKENIRKHFSAFANARGGWIIFGIEEVKDKVGRPVDLKIAGIKNLPDNA